METFQLHVPNSWNKQENRRIEKTKGKKQDSNLETQKAIVE